VLARVIAFREGLEALGWTENRNIRIEHRYSGDRIDPNNPDRRKINALAEKLVSCALAGEGWAFKEFGDRLEGKAVQPIEHSGEDNRTIMQFSDDELTAILRRRVGVVPVESDEERPESEPLN
jgi:hypothetical protein